MALPMQSQELEDQHDVSFESISRPKGCSTRNEPNRDHSATGQDGLLLNPLSAIQQTLVFSSVIIKDTSIVLAHKQPREQHPSGELPDEVDCATSKSVDSYIPLSSYQMRTVLHLDQQTISCLYPNNQVCVYQHLVGEIGPSLLGNLTN